MNISPIRTQSDHRKAVGRIGALMAQDLTRGTPESDELEVLAQLVELYEKKHFPLAAADSVDLILFAMEQRGLTKKEMVPYLGSASRVSEVLGRKRPLTLEMIRKLHTGLGLPVEALVMADTVASGKKLSKVAAKRVRSQRRSGIPVQIAAVGKRRVGASLVASAARV